MKRTVSIITPTQNHANYSDQCMSRVLGQSYDAWEHIIIHNAPNDSTWGTICRHAESDTRIIPVHQLNKGTWRLEETYNTALAKCTGHLIAIPEGDYRPADKLSIQVSEVTSQGNIMISFGQAVMSKSSGSGEFYGPRRPEFTVSTKIFQFYLFGRGSWVQPVTVLIDRLAPESVCRFKEIPSFLAVDFTTWIELMASDGFVMHVDHPLGFWRIHDSQTTREHGLAIIERACQAVMAQAEQLPQQAFIEMGITFRQVCLISDRHFAPAYILAMEKILRSREAALAKRYGLRALTSGRPTQKKVSLVGLLPGAFKADMKRLAHL